MTVRTLLRLRRARAATKYPTGRKQLESALRDTGRKRVEEQLYLREQDFRTITENTPDPIARYDSECRCVYMNPALQRLLGKDARELLGKTPLESSRNLDTLRPYEQKIREALRTGRETQLELISDSFCRTGRPICDHIRFTPEFGRDGKVVSVLAVGRDIANFKAVERQLSNSGAMLRTLVARQEKEREAERKRVAWEVHEELGQLLAALRFHLHLPQESNDAARPPKHAAPLSSIQLLDRALGIARGLASSLRPRVLDLGIKAAMEWLAVDFTRRHGIPCRMQCHEELELDEEQVTVLFRIAQEVLANIAGQAEAYSAGIIVERRGDNHVLMVRHDAKGTDCVPSGEGKLDLLLIHERVRTIGGSVAIRREGDHGATLEVSVPASPASLRQRAW